MSKALKTGDEKGVEAPLGVASLNAMAGCFLELVALNATGGAWSETEAATEVGHQVRMNELTAALVEAICGRCIGRTGWTVTLLAGVAGASLDTGASMEVSKAPLEGAMVEAALKSAPLESTEASIALERNPGEAGALDGPM